MLPARNTQAFTIDVLQHTPSFVQAPQLNDNQKAPGALGTSQEHDSDTHGHGTGTSVALVELMQDVYVEAPHQAAREVSQLTGSYRSEPSEAPAQL